jgi:hypothetical protein
MGPATPAITIAKNTGENNGVFSRRRIVMWFNLQNSRFNVKYHRPPSATRGQPFTSLKGLRPQKILPNLTFWPQEIADELETALEQVRKSRPV